MKPTPCLMTLAGFLVCMGDVLAADGFVLKAGQGETMMNGIVAKISPKNAETHTILVEQTFRKGGSTTFHYHEQGDELFYVVEGKGIATLKDKTYPIAKEDAVFDPKGVPHKLANLDHEKPLIVVFFMDSPELVEQFRATYERQSNEPDRAMTSEERAKLERRYGGAVEVKEGDPK